ncbi:HlyD family type I secretion periplasmic adaptor subunit [Photobacterium sanctipauli]|uniref:Membrane fusion protein (MFP) family protein n=1 Tax=Photobacterium sanctipauli TaxID=1342794 RepID=A0A2T3N8H8_9GAMM|nr:HlyD family type I secretion periplasmic adaptor subunit [Photobacterium sanctipauli]PSW09573.1 HlyD family type I secretion periplasmic adaptor subunit [Photobacterium sanctipauli]
MTKQQTPLPAEILPEWEQLRRYRPTRLLRTGVWSLLGLVVLVVIWLCLAQVDTFVVAKGQVKKGELLAVLDNTVSLADVKALEYQVKSAEARIRRLQAELDEEATFDAFQVGPQQRLEAALYRARQAELEASLSSKKQQLNSLQLRMESLRGERSIVTEQVVLLGQLVGDKKQRFQQEKDQFRRQGPRKEEYFTAQSQWLEARRRQAAIESSLVGLAAEVSSTQAGIERFLSQRNADTSLQLVESIREFIELKQQLVASRERLRLVNIFAPFDAIVLRYADKTIGTRVNNGDFLFELVPVDSPMEVVVDLNPADISQVVPGDPVTIKLDTLPFTKFGTLSGELRQVSEDTLEDGVSGRKTLTYRGWIDILSQEHLRQLPDDFRLQPGLTLEANINTGQRSLISYLLYPIARALDESFREP